MATELIFFVTENLDTRDIRDGKLYDRAFNPLTVEDVATLGTEVHIHPVTPARFELLQGASEMDVDISIEIRE